MLLVLGFSALCRRFPRAMRVFAQVQVVALLVAIGIGLDRAYRGVDFNMPAIVAGYLFFTLALTAAGMRRPRPRDPVRDAAVGAANHVPADNAPRGSARELDEVLKRLRA
jgi:hypothetical protein